MKFIVPRKYRSLLYKLLVIVPVIWLTVILIAHNSSNSSGAGGGSGGGGGDDVLQQLPLDSARHPKQLPSVQNPVTKRDFGIREATDNNRIDNAPAEVNR